MLFKIQKIIKIQKKNKLKKKIVKKKIVKKKIVKKILKKIFKKKIAKKIAKKIEIIDEPGKDTIIIKPNFGLCNRLRFMFSYIQKLKDLNKFDTTKLVVCWPKDKECPYFYLDSLVKIPNVTFVKTNNISNKKINFSSGGYVHGYKGKNIINNILFSPRFSILNEIKDIIKKLRNNYISVHIRRTDHVGLAKKNNQYTDDNNFINFLRINKNYNIFLATDSLDTQKKFKKLFNNRIKYIKWINNKSSEKRKTAFKDTIIDLFVCAFAKKFMPSGYSSYSEFIKLIRTDNHLLDDINFSPLQIVDNYINKLK